MKLQNIIFPQNDICSESSLYYHKKQSIVEIENGLAFVRDGCAVFDTYFNSFSFSKWKKYTKIQNLRLLLELDGNFQVILLKKYLKNNKIISEIITKYENCSGKSDFDFGNITDFDSQNIMLCFELTCLSDSGILKGGFYFTDIPSQEISEVRIAADICTYKREEYIKKNLRKLNESFLKNKNSRLYSNLEIFIADNGRTLPRSLNSDKIHIFPNKNTGGSGGFTRGIIEIKKTSQEKQFTHILLMDDDAVINPESIFRTYSVLSLIKPEHKYAFLGGGMLRTDQPSIQVESGAQWNRGKIISQKHNLSLSTCENCLYNETEQHPDYLGWWFCAFPIEKASDENLPLPLFIKCDDIEYSLRSMKEAILINGICIWHDDFETKYSSASLYYIQRNTLIDNAVHKLDYSWFRFFKEMKYLAVHELMFYRYKNALLMIRACYDFMKGVEWLKNCDPEQLNSEIIASGYQFKNLNLLPIPFDEAAYQKTCAIPDDHGFEKCKRKLKMNGIFMPAKKENNGLAFVPTFRAESKHFYRVKTAFHYDEFINKAFITKRDYKKLIKIYFKILLLGIYSIFHYRKTCQNYYSNAKELMTLDFWKKYLNLK